MSDTMTSPLGEEFVLDKEPADVVVKGTTGELRERQDRQWVTKEGEIFLFADAKGDVVAENAAGAGLYYKDTRFLSELVLTVDGRAPLLLSTSGERAFMTQVHLSNTQLRDSGAVVAPEETVSIHRVHVVRDRLYEHLSVHNYNDAPVRMRLELRLAADFADIFEVRGFKRSHRGQLALPKASGDSAAFAYRGVDGVFRETRVGFQPPPRSVTAQGRMILAAWHLELEPGATEVIEATVEPRIGGPSPPDGALASFGAAVDGLLASYAEFDRSCTQIETDNELFNALLARGIHDLRALRTPTDQGAVLAAGIPWFVAPFGRDTLLTCHQTLLLNPQLAREAIAVLAANQASARDDWRDADPGKILHELRQGELAGAGLIPHTPYYGSVDSTPLWLLLVASYYRWTGDLAFVSGLLPNIDRALAWMDGPGDADGDGFLEYERRSALGLRNQGWKDSDNSVVHADGTLAEGPIALAEVQGYAYVARRRIAEVYDALGSPGRAQDLRATAATLRERFNERFWLDDERCFAMALDGAKRPVATMTSNPAHGLYCGIVDRDKAALLARRLLAPDMFSGWGIRTMSERSAAYNPMSYHDGSVWPHDNALVAAGLKRYGFDEATNQVATALFETAATVEHLRLPELFCGFPKTPPASPVDYPVACSPQAWAAGSPFLVLQAMLGISARAPENTLTVNRPMLPAWLRRVELRGLRVGDSTISLVFQRQGAATGFSVLEKQGRIRILMEE